MLSLPFPTGSQQRLLNLPDQERQVGLSEAQARGRDAVMLYVRGNVLMVGMRGGQRGVIGVRLGIIPVELLATAPDLIAVSCDSPMSSSKSQSFGYAEDDVIGKKELTLQYTNAHPTADENQRGLADRRKVLRNGVDKVLIPLN